ncbi:MAG: putative membrane protein [uncultured Nocardioides sp.]|uniref:Putative membrane protein n=1 Tax=uncultured Nocardioides sp. TaxID=198441 RepID=A0A6J4P112_9ACTN|nr:MAG: putative membrane protein [uncultured Nocardioides sp.]
MSVVPAEPLTRRGIPLDRDLRVLALGSFANRFGSGAVITTSAIYFTRHVGFSAAEVAFAFAVAGVVAILVQVPAGHLGDVLGPRRVLTWFMVGAAATAALPALATQPWMLALALALLTFFERAAGAVQQGVIAQLATGGRGVLFKAYLRAVTNSAIGLGAVFGGLALVVDERWAYLGVFVLNAGFTALAAWNTTRLPDLPAYVRGAGEPRLGVLRDLPFVVITAITGVFSLHFVVMELGMALYIVERTEAPRVMVAVLLVMNTIAVTLFQVRLSRRADSVTSGARALLVGACLIAVGFAIVAFAERGDATTAVVLLVVGSLVHVVGEMIGSGGQWGLQMGLAPHERQGQYQGFAGLGFSLTHVVGPPLVALCCVQLGEVGWLALSVLMVLTGLVAVPVSRWALASRERYGVTTHSG